MGLVRRRHVPPPFPPSSLTTNRNEQLRRPRAGVPRRARAPPRTLRPRNPQPRRLATSQQEILGRSNAARQRHILGTHTWGPRTRRCRRRAAQVRKEALRRARQARGRHILPARAERTLLAARHAELGHGAGGGDHPRVAVGGGADARCVRPRGAHDFRGPV